MYTNEAERLERNDSKISVSIQLKATATKKLRLRVWAYSIGEYWYILSKSGLTQRHRPYVLEQQRFTRMRRGPKRGPQSVKKEEFSI